MCKEGGSKIDQSSFNSSQKQSFLNDCFWLQWHSYITCILNLSRFFGGVAELNQFLVNRLGRTCLGWKWEEWWN